MLFKKTLLSLLVLSLGVNAFAQVVPPVNVWTPGGGNIYFNGGNVGIGLTTPLYPLHVAGNAYISNSINAQTAIVGSVRTDSVRTGVINVPTGLNGKDLRIYGGSTISGSVTAVSYRATGLASAGERYVFVDSTGTFRISPPPGGGANDQVQHCVTQAPWMIGGNVLGAIRNAVIGPCDNHDFVMQAGGTPYMWLKPTGRVGIGNEFPTGLVEIKTTANSNSDPPPFLITSTTQYGNVDSKLFEVTYNGQVFSRELFVQVTAFPDYVFKKDYRLMPLNKLEEYIQKQGHLPNIPPAQQIEKDGQNVGKLQLLQMEKIEELTLYLLELKKENEQLRSEVNELKKAISK